MLDSTMRKWINHLLRSLAAREPHTYRLGTPQLIETDEVQQLVDLGPQIVPYLIERSNSAPPQEAAYIILVLGKLGDTRAIVPLRQLRTKYQALESKAEWEYAVIGQCNVAIEMLERSEQ